MIDIAIAFYVTIGWGVFLAALCEGEKIIWSFGAGIFWPLVLVRVWQARFNR